MAMFYRGGTPGWYGNSKKPLGVTKTSDVMPENFNQPITQPWKPINVPFGKKATLSVPDTPATVVASSNRSQSVRIADPDIIQFDDETVPIELITDLTFEQIGGQEIINIARNDLINGQNVIYKPIKNLQDIYLKYNPNNIIGLQQTSEETFRNFPIKLANYIPEQGSGPNGNYVYLDQTTGDIVIDLINIRPGDQVDIDTVNQANTFDDTIYVESNS